MCFAWYVCKNAHVAQDSERNMNHTPWVLTCAMNASNIILFFLLTWRVCVLNFTPLFKRATSTMECRITASNPTLPPFICPRALNATSLFNHLCLPSTPWHKNGYKVPQVVRN